MAEKPKLKRMSDVTKPVVAPGPYGEDIPVYSLSKTEYIFSTDWIIKGFKSLEGDNGEYVHMLVEPVTGIGPEGETADVVISTGARAILGRLEQLTEKDFPILTTFTRGKGRGSNVWYDMA